ncbi:MAG: hypothetical protein B1H40_03755 [Candidatus Latescibacteria bacterium 4484_181]|nr:MAG: hypothetical protein B1H40_03755 [Candidatus Latescibacteria bacterium 4484_181]RKY67886.1 MAG: hypothetical protein DRQ02_05975 [Candidatus Latescibacterota bacterium]RKY74075.1 MAG: hypothetical protein DRQ24_00605 [Candidatus Latescibacterota bacterium]
MTVFDDSTVLVTAGEASFGKDFFIVAKRFQRCELPDCGPSLLRQPRVVTIEDLVSAYADSPRAKKCCHKGRTPLKLKTRWKALRS